MTLCVILCTCNWTKSSVLAPSLLSLFFCVFVSLSICLSVCLSVCLSLHLSLQGEAHQFEVTSFYEPHFCRHCGTLLYGLYNQGVRCRVCGMVAHRRCQDKTMKQCRTVSYTVRNSIPRGLFYVALMLAVVYLGFKCCSCLS